MLLFAVSSSNIFKAGSRSVTPVSFLSGRKGRSQKHRSPKKKPQLHPSERRSSNLNAPQRHLITPWSFTRRLPLPAAGSSAPHNPHTGHLEQDLVQPEGRMSTQPSKQVDLTGVVRVGRTSLPIRLAGNITCARPESNQAMGSTRLRRLSLPFKSIAMPPCFDDKCAPTKHSIAARPSSPDG